jgi:hypothetical protein
MRSPSRVPALLTAAGLVLAGRGTGGPAAAQDRTPQSQKTYLQALKGTVWVVMTGPEGERRRQHPARLGGRPRLPRPAGRPAPGRGAGGARGAVRRGG